MEEYTNMFTGLFEQFDLTGINMQDVVQNMNDQFPGMFPGRSPAEIQALMGPGLNLMNNIIARAAIPITIKEVSQHEFLFYMLADTKDICPKIKKWKRENGNFYIEYKDFALIDVNMKNKKHAVTNLIEKLHSMGIFHANINKNAIVYDESTGVRLIDFSQAGWIDGLDDEQFLLNNPYGKPCNTLQELLDLELSMVDEIFGVDVEEEKELEIKNTIREIFGKRDNDNNDNNDDINNDNDDNNEFKHVKITAVNENNNNQIPLSSKTDENIDYYHYYTH
jgi:hypothetical protein